MSKILDEYKNEASLDYSIIGPAMNEAGNIEEYIERCIKGFAGTDLTFEVIIVNDGSTDDTMAVLNKIQSQNANENILICNHRKNFGLTNALKTGIDKAIGEHIIWISTDLESYPDEDIPKFIEGFNEGADVVVGARIGRGDGKHLASKIYNAFCRKLFNIDLEDMNWTKAFKRECIDHLELRSDWHRFIIVMLHTAGFDLVEKPMNWYKRKYGKSKFGLSRFPKSIIDAISVYFFINFSAHPMRFFGGLGLLFGLVGSTTLIGLFVFYINTSTQIRPLFWLSLVFLLFALNLIMFGFIAELITFKHQKSKLVLRKKRK